MDMMLEQFKTIFDRPEKVKNLREIILDLAVRGRLVQQDPNDEHASILLERINEEKEKLIKEKKSKKFVKLPEININEKYDNLPEGWVLCRLGDIVTYKNGYAFSSKHMNSSKVGIPVIKSNTIMKKKVIFNHKTDYVSNIDKKMEECYVNKGDLLMCLSSQSANVEPLGITALYENEDKALLNQRVLKLTPIGEIKNTVKFILNSINSKEFHEVLSNKGSGSAQSNLKLEHVLQMEFKLPPLEEQKRIIEKIDSLMKLCDELEKVLENKIEYSLLSSKSIFNSISNIKTADELEEALKFILLNFKDISLGENAIKELKNCILQLAIQGKLVEQNPDDEPVNILFEKIKEEKERLIREKKIKKQKKLPEISKEEEPFQIPKEWIFCRLGTISEKIGAGSTPRGGKSVYIDEGIKFIRSQNVYNDSLILSNIAFISNEIHEKMIGSKVQSNDLLMNITGGSIGRCCIVPSDFDVGNVNQHVSIIRLIDQRLIYFVHNVLISRYIFESIMNMQVGISREGLSISKLSKLIIPLPPLEEQKRIVEKVDSLMILCDELEKKIEEQKEYSNNLMESVIKSLLS